MVMLHQFWTECLLYAKQHPRSPGSEMWRRVRKRQPVKCENVLSIWLKNLLLALVDVAVGDW